MTPTWRPTMATLVEGHMRRNILPTLGRRPLASIRRTDVEAWAGALDLAPSTVATVRQHLGQILAAAVWDGLIARNPAKGARMPRVEDRRTRPLDLSVVDALARAAPDWFAIALQLGLGLGLRQGEACGLTVDRIDFLRRSVRVDQQLLLGTSSEAPKLGPPKTDSS